MWNARCLPLIPSVIFLLATLLLTELKSEQLLVGSIGKANTSSRGQKTEKLIREKILSEPDRQIDEFCSELDQTCFIIVDRVRKFGDGLIAYRRLRRRGPQGILALSETRLQPPSSLTWENFNTKTWEIRKDTVRLLYARTMIVGAFMSGALEFNTKRKQDILIIGLGGGVLNNYFTNMKNQTLNVTIVDIDPVMKKIAEKWFGFKESPLHRIVIDDGVRYIHEAARRGEKFDLIIVDVCYNVILPLMGPTDEFLEGELISSIKKITADTGAVIVNTVTRKATRDAADKVLFPYSLHFPSCYFIVHGDGEKLLFCSAKENNSYLNNRDELYNRFVAVDKALEFQLLDTDYCSSYPLA